MKRTRNKCTYPDRKKEFWSSRFLLGLFVILTLALLIPSAALAQKEESQLPDYTLKKIKSVEGDDYVYIFCNPLDDLRVKKLITGANATAEKFDIDVRFFGPNKPYHCEQVVEILKKIKEKSPAGIAVEIGHPSKFDKAIGQAVESEIGVISFSLDDWTHNPRQGYVGYDWRKEGKKLADHLLEDLPPLSKLLVLDSVTKKDRHSHSREKGLLDRAREFHHEYDILWVEPNTENAENTVMDYLSNTEVDAIISLWGEITEPLAEVIMKHNLQSVRAGGFGCCAFEKYVNNGTLDVLMKVVTDLEGGLPLETLYYSVLYDITPSSIHLHAEPVTSS